MKTRRANGYLPMLLVLIVIVIGVGIYFAYASLQQKQAPAELNLATPLFYPVAGETTDISFTVANQGGQATQVSVTLTSSAFSSSSVTNLQPVTVPAGGQTAISFPMPFADIANGQYSISTSISYQDSNGTHTTTGPTLGVYVLPNVKVTGFAWEATGLLNLQQKSSIGPTDNTKLNFNVQSDGSSAVYTGLTTTVSISPQVSQLSVSPSSQPVENLAPGGKSSQYSFTITSSAAPPGKYNVTIEILADGNVAATQTVVLTVSS